MWEGGRVLHYRVVVQTVHARVFSVMARKFVFSVHVTDNILIKTFASISRFSDTYSKFTIRQYHSFVHSL